MDSLKEIADCVDRLNAALLEKGWRLPNCQYNFDGQHWFQVRANHPVDGGESLYKYCGGNDEASYAFDKAMALVRKQPDASNAALDDFRTALGKLIDKGHKLGIETEWLNPLTQQMRKLSTNIVAAE